MQSTDAGKGWNLKNRQNNTKLFHWSNRFLEVPAAKAACLDLVSSRFRSLSSLPARNFLGYLCYHSCKNSNNPSYTNFSVTTIPAVCSSKHCWCSLPRSQRLSASGMRLSTPLMCTARISNSHLAATNSSSLRHPCRKELCDLPVFNTVTDVSLSHCITMRNPRHSFPHTLAATITVNSSRALMLRLLLVTLSGNCAWKYSCRVWNHAPQPCRHASVATTSSGKDHPCHGIMDTPLYPGRNLLHHQRSFLTLSGTSHLPALGKPLMNSNNLEMNSLPGLTQAAMKASFPTRLSTSFLLAIYLPNHSSNSVMHSRTRSSDTSRVSFSVSNWTPRNIIFVHGLTDLCSASTAPINLNVSFRVS